MPPIKAVLFDYGLVLSGPQQPAAWDSMMQTLQADNAELNTAYWNHRHDYDRGALTGETYWRAVAKDVRGRISDKQLAELLAADVALWTQPNPPMIEWAGRLQRAGVKTGILSNIGDAMETGIRAQATWLEGFAHHTFSHRLRTAKPDVAIYLHAAEGLSVDPGKILFIDDREENIAGAEAAGMQAIQYLDHEEFVAAMRERGYGSLLDV